MFEKEAEEYMQDKFRTTSITGYNSMKQAFKAGAEFGYNKANEELMLKLKDEGIVKPLKDSIFRNERLSSQEQQELCAWIECAMDFGENLDECAKELEELHKDNEWHYPSKGEYPEKGKEILLYTKTLGLIFGEFCEGYNNLWTSNRCDFMTEEIIAWIEKEKIIPKEVE